MKEIVVLSGKGGTGKTTVTAAFAKLFQKYYPDTFVIADCDVDAANMHLLVEEKRLGTIPFSSGQVPVMDFDTCSGCGICADECRYSALVMTDGYPRRDEVLCEGCSLCMHLCPVEAITMQDETTGKWIHSATAGERDNLYHAELEPGGEHSGKLVAKVREEAARWAESRNVDKALMDGPPGIGCPVISTITGTDYVVLVTEPTLSGLHDLRRVVSLVQERRIPMGCIINKSDINQDVAGLIYDFVEEHDILLLGQLPYSNVVTDALSRGKTIIELAEESSEAGTFAKYLEAVWRKLLKEVE